MSTQADILTAIVKRALVETVTDLGQLSNTDKSELNRAVRAGILTKGKGGPFPILKNVYAVSGFDFALDRACSIADMRRSLMILNSRA